MIDNPEWNSWSPEQVQKHFGEKVRERRLQFGLTQQQLGEIAGLTKQAIKDIEKGRRSTVITKAIKIADCLKTNVPYLAGATDDDRMPTT